MGWANWWGDGDGDCVGGKCGLVGVGVGVNVWGEWLGQNGGVKLGFVGVVGRMGGGEWVWRIGGVKGWGARVWIGKLCGGDSWL